MNALIFILAPLVLLGGGVLAGYYARLFIALGKRRSIEVEIKQSEIEAREKAQTIVREATEKSEELLAEIKRIEKEKSDEARRTEERLIKKEEMLDRRQEETSRETEALKARIEEVKLIKERADDLALKRAETLAVTARMTPEEARAEIFARAELECAEDLSHRLAKFDTAMRERLDQRAKEILATSVHRLAVSTASELMTTNVAIPSEDIKGKIIGKEGRNIRTFEREAGVELVIDENPGFIVISSFDPVRRQVARVALERLIEDGRIQPAKIEEEIKRAKEDINEIIKEKGEEAVRKTGVYNLDPRIIAILGRLHFRTSYGQNVLAHSIEMTHVAGMLAEELGADVTIAKAGALVHDIGKALDHEVEGTHIAIGMRILERFGADPRIITAMKSHHDDWPHETVEAVIVQTADIISGGRPGARSDSVENYLKRLADLEGLVNNFTGIEKSYALQAGREIRIFVTPDKVTDTQARTLARDIAIRIESELRYPGEIKVTMIRETRVIEFAR